MRTTHVFLLAILIAAPALSAAAEQAPRPVETAADDAELADLDRQLLHSMIVERRSEIFAATAVPSVRVLAPGGLVEDKDQVLAGLEGWDAQSISVTGAKIVRHGDVAIVTGRLDIEGTLKPVGRPGPLKYLATYVREDNRWKLLSRALTPCLDILIKLGRC